MNFTPVPDEAVELAKSIIGEVAQPNRSVETYAQQEVVRNLFAKLGINGSQFFRNNIILGALQVGYVLGAVAQKNGAVEWAAPKPKVEEPKPAPAPVVEAPAVEEVATSDNTYADEPIADLIEQLKSGEMKWNRMQKLASADFLDLDLDTPNKAELTAALLDAFEAMS